MARRNVIDYGRYIGTPTIIIILQNKFSYLVKKIYFYTGNKKHRCETQFNISE